jgi:hypothetical protein
MVALTPLKEERLLATAAAFAEDEQKKVMRNTIVKMENSFLFNPELFMAVPHNYKTSII